jgi:hypothetical protein
MPVVFIMFLWTVPMGAVLFAIAWLPTRQLASRSRTWRLFLSSVVGLSVAPTMLEFCGRNYICPAIYASLMLLAPDSPRRCVGLVHGILPLVTATALIFCVWSYHVERARKIA